MHWALYLRPANVAVFFIVDAYLFFLTVNTPLQEIAIPESIIAAFAYILGVRLRSFDPISFSWLLTGSLTVLSYFFLAPYETSLGFVLLVSLIITSYELTRFSFSSTLGELSQTDRKLRESATYLAEDYPSRCVISITATVLISVVAVALSSISLQNTYSLIETVALASVVLGLVLVLGLKFQR